MELHAERNIISASSTSSQYKKRRISLDKEISSFEGSRELKDSLPTLRSQDYYVFPSLNEISIQVLVDPGYSSRVSNFTVGKFGFGSVRYFGLTDVRWLDLNEIVKFRRHEVIVYEDKNVEPVLGQGLNKPAEVTLVLQLRTTSFGERQVENIVKKLRQSSERQGACFISFDPSSCEWKFSVNHFSRFGLSEDEEEDILMGDVNTVQDSTEIDHEENSDVDEETEMGPVGSELFHSLPAHLGLDPRKMKEMKMLMFSGEVQDLDEVPKHQMSYFGNEYVKLPLEGSTKRMSHKSSPPVRKTPLALIEYNHGSLDRNSLGTILMAQQNKGIALKPVKAEGFKLDLMHETPITVNHSRNIVDAGLFMGRSFRVGWGPNGVLVHTGNLIGSSTSHRVLSSVVNLEKIAIDKVVRDENDKVQEELVDSAFVSPLNLHKELNHEFKVMEVGSFELKLQKVVSNRLMISKICRSYMDIVERQLEVSGLSSSARLGLTHNIMVWELIKVLFSDREKDIVQVRTLIDDIEEEMLQDVNDASPQVEEDALPLIRRAEFSCWLQESVFPRVQAEISSLKQSNYLDHIFLLLSGRKLDAAVELAASRGDVRLACLLSQAGGSIVNRSDVKRQLDLWRMNGMDFSFIEKERVRIYELLAGNIHGALHDIEFDWKRFFGLLMWYGLPPQAPLPIVFQNYQHLLNSGRAPHPVPVYADQGPLEEVVSCGTKGCFDLSYFLMLLHASEDIEFGFLKTMFSASSSTQDPLDYHMIWHQRGVLEAVGAISSSDLHVLDMGLVSQLLCLGQCHWAVYVVLHMPFREDFPYLQAKVIREILFQYCESWSSKESQIQFIQNLGVPRAWLHEAMAVYSHYYGDLPKALEHFIECRNWKKAHTIFITLVAPKLFFSDEHSEIWKLATLMEDHKSEIEKWDLGAGIYIMFYSLKSSLQESDNTMSELDSLESRVAAYGEFLGHLNGSLADWGDRLPAAARVVYSKMGEEISRMLLSDISEVPTRDSQLSCFDSVFDAPIPEDLRSNYLQDAAMCFTCFLSEIAS